MEFGDTSPLYFVCVCSVGHLNHCVFVKFEMSKLILACLSCVRVLGSGLEKRRSYAFILKLAA